MNESASTLGDEVTSGIIDIGVFVESREFQNLLAELRAVPRSERTLFVRDVILNPDELDNRGLQVPAGMAIQRSYFADNRPTLFCVTKYMIDKKWKVTITFDEEGVAGSLPIAKPPSA